MKIDATAQTIRNEAKKAGLRASAVTIRANADDTCTLTACRCSGLEFVESMAEKYGRLDVRPMRLSAEVECEIERQQLARRGAR